MRMEKRNKIQFIVFLLLLTATVTLYFLTLRSSTNSIDPSLFKIEHLERIDHIILESAKGKTDLRFREGKWKVNNEFDADKRLIDVLFATIEQAVPKRTISQSKSDSISKSVADLGTVVSFFEGEEVKKKFIAGGNPEKTQAYFQLPEGATYVMSIPGYRVYVSGIFEADANLFRDKRVFNFNWRNFKSLEATFSSEPKEDFKVSFKDKAFGIEGISAIDTTKLNDYLDAVSLLDVSEYLSKEQIVQNDSLLRTAPAFSVEVKDIAGRSYLLEVFSPSIGKTVVLGRIGKTDVVAFDRDNIAPLAKKKTYFIRRE
jgi:hypothetical protein